MNLIKVWGRETKVESMGKLLSMYEQHCTSIHKHEKLKEVLYVLDGLVYIQTGEQPDQLVGDWFGNNEYIQIPPGKWHRIIALKDSTIVEFSTERDDDDVVRHADGGKISPETFRTYLSKYYQHANRERILSIEEARITAEMLHKEGRNIGFCSGCFDLMHLGHVELLSQAKGRCEVLFVGVHDDISSRSLKGQPIVKEIGRMGMVVANRFVDYVVPAGGNTCADIIEAIKPNLYFITADVGVKTPEAKVAESCGAVVDVIDILEGYSTTAVLKSILDRLPKKAK
jgi:D-beta-D-heptose 7-phosphate kinase/D-beta-D-heptose 1-phosphate adenosyltransferase